MPRKPSDVVPEPNWHLDFRDPATLPEDRVVRVRFLINLSTAAVALLLLIILGWQLLLRATVSTQLDFWTEKMALHRQEYEQLQVELRNYMTEAGKIKDAYDITYTPFVPSAFILEVGRTLPASMTVDMIGFNDNVVTIRGTLAETPERASRALGGYVDTLRRDPKIGPLFSDISVPNLDRVRLQSLFNFVIVLKLRPPVSSTQDTAGTPPPT